MSISDIETQMTAAIQAQLDGDYTSAENYATAALGEISKLPTESGKTGTAGNNMTWSHEKIQAYITQVRSLARSRSTQPLIQSIPMQYSTDRSVL